MSDLLGNHIVGFLMRRLEYCVESHQKYYIESHQYYSELFQKYDLKPSEKNDNASNCPKTNKSHLTIFAIIITCMSSKIFYVHFVWICTLFICLHCYSPSNEKLYSKILDRFH